MEGRAIGSVSLRVDPVNSVGELEYAVGRNYWRQGIAMEATTAVVDWGFHTLGMEKVFSTADARNAGAIRVMEKLGMIQEGRASSTKHAPSTDDAHDPPLAAKRGTV